MRTHYGPWQPCWISNQHQKHNSGRGPSSEHFWQVWLISVQWFQRRRFKCEKLTDGRTDGRTTDTYPWQKLTWPMARWAKKIAKLIGWVAGADPGFQVRGAHLKKLHRVEGGTKIFGVFRVKNHDFTPKNHIFSNCGGRREHFWGISCEKSRFYAKKSYFFQF